MIEVQNPKLELPSPQAVIDRWSFLKSEKWYWLAGFCWLSLIVHVGVGLNSRDFRPPFVPPKVQEIEVALEPLPEPPKPVVEQKPTPPPPPPAPRQAAIEKPTTQPTVSDVQRDQKIMRMAMRPAPKLVLPAAPSALVPLPQPALKLNAPVSAVKPSPIIDEPIASGLPQGMKNAGAPKMTRVARLDPIPGGGGAPAPGIVLGGKGGAPTPENPIEDVTFFGGGAGGMKLPREAPRMGGGGGRSILSVENPLAKELIPEDKPGAGPGTGGGAGKSGGTGVGFVQGAGIGTRPDGRVALGTLRAKPGDGIGAGVGSGIGTRSPGGGRGTGSELPGTGGTGEGYGRGSGIGFGTGTGVGAGDGGGARIGLNRGIPFGDIAGMLKGGEGGGGGGGGAAGRGGVFGAGPTGGGGGPVHIVYVMDVSYSMQEGDKISRAKEALKKALSELKAVDSFNIIIFFDGLRTFSDEMVKASRGNIDAAKLYIDFITLRPATRLDNALQAALSLPAATHIFLLSDGEPNRGITDHKQLRTLARELNTKKIPIIALALGLGEQWPGMDLLKGIAADSKGQFSYVNLRKPQ